MLVRDRVTGQVGNLPDNELQQYAGRYEPVSQPQAVAQPTQQAPQQSLLEKAGSFLKGAGKTMINPFIETGKTIGAATVQTPMMLQQAAAIGLSANQKLPKPVRDYLTKVASDLEKNTPKFRSDQEMNQASTDPGKFFLDKGVRPSAGVAAYAVPFSKAGFVAGLAPGAVSGALSDFSREDSTLESTLGAAGVGAITGGVLNKFLGPGAGKSLKGAGDDIQKSIFNPKVAGGATSASEEKALVEEAAKLSQKYGVKLNSGSAQARREVSAELYPKILEQAKKAVGQTKPVSTQSFLSRIKSSVLETGENFVVGDSAYAKQLNRELSILGKRMGTKSNELTKLEQKLLLGNKLGKAFNKETLSIPEAVRMDIWRAMDDAVSPAAKPFTLDMSTLQQLAPGLKKSSESGLHIPILGQVNALGRPVQWGSSKVGEVLSGLGAGQGAVAKAVGPLVTKAGVTGATAIAGQKPTSTNEQPLSENDPLLNQVLQEKPGQTQQGGMSQENYQQALMWDYINNQGKDISKITAMYEAGQGGKKTEMQAARSEMGSLVEDAISQFSANPNLKIGPVEGRIQDVKAIINAADPASREFAVTLSALQASIAKARAGTSFTPNEQALLNRYSPSANDSVQNLTTKLKVLRKMFNDKGGK